MAGENREAGRASEPSWWSAGDVPDDLPSWARRGLSESPESSEGLTPSAPVRHRRTRAPEAGSRLRGWGLAVASVAAAAAAVPLAISTLAASDDAYSLPRVGTFPVVAPGSLPPGPAAPGPATGAPGAAGAADAGTLPPLADPSVVVAAPPRTVVAPRAVTRAEPTTPVRRTTPRGTTGGTTTGGTTEVDATPDAAGTDDDGAPTANGQGGQDAGGGGTPTQGTGDADPQPRSSVLDDVLDVPRTALGTVGSVLR